MKILFWVVQFISNLCLWITVIIIINLDYIHITIHLSFCFRVLEAVCQLYICRKTFICPFREFKLATWTILPY